MSDDDGVDIGFGRKRMSDGRIVGLHGETLDPNRWGAMPGQIHGFDAFGKPLDGLGLQIQPFGGASSTEDTGSTGSTGGSDPSYSITSSGAAYSGGASGPATTSRNGSSDHGGLGSVLARLFGFLVCLGLFAAILPWSRAWIIDAYRSVQAGPVTGFILEREIDLYPVFAGDYDVVGVGRDTLSQGLSRSGSLYVLSDDVGGAISFGAGARNFMMPLVNPPQDATAVPGDFLGIAGGFIALEQADMGSSGERGVSVAFVAPGSSAPSGRALLEAGDRPEEVLASEDLGIVIVSVLRRVGDDVVKTYRAYRGLEPVRSWQAARSFARPIALSQEGDFLLDIATDNVVVWSMQTGRAAGRWTLPEGQDLVDVSFGCGGRAVSLTLLTEAAPEDPTFISIVEAETGAPTECPDLASMGIQQETAIPVPGRDALTIRSPTQPDRQLRGGVVGARLGTSGRWISIDRQGVMRIWRPQQ